MRKRVYYTIACLVLRNNGKDKITFLYECGWEHDKNGKIPPYANYYYRFDTINHLRKKGTHPLSFTHREALELAGGEIDIDGVISLVPSNHEHLF